MVHFKLYLFLSSIFIFCIIPTELITPQTYRFRCNTSRNYTASSAFPANLDVTLSSLYINATHSGGFYNTSAGQGPDRANGLFLCRGDISPRSCQRCIEETSQEIVKICTNQTEAILWHDVCMLRYSNSSIFSILAEEPKVFRRSPFSTRESEKFDSALSGLMNDLARMAVSNNEFFATKEVNVTSFDRIYGLVQCTQDITAPECHKCLVGCINDIPKCCGGQEGGRVLTPSCNIRYEAKPFYQAPSPPPDFQPSLPSPNSGGKPICTSTSGFSKMLF